MIVDDEPLAIEILEAYISKVDQLELLASFDSGIAAMAFLKKKRRSQCLPFLCGTWNR